MPTATVMGSYVNDFFNLIEAKRSTIFCDICYRFLEKTKKHLKSTSHSMQTGEKTKCNLCGSNINKIYFQLHIKPIKLYSEQVRKPIVASVKKIMTLINI